MRWELGASRQLLASLQALYACAGAEAKVSKDACLHENSVLLTLAFPYGPFMSVAALNLASWSCFWLGFSTGHMEALPYNRALCERNVGNEATSIPKCASPDLWGPPGSSVLTLPSNRSHLPRDLTLKEAVAGRRYWHSPALEKEHKVAQGPSFPSCREADSRCKSLEPKALLWEISEINPHTACIFPVHRQKERDWTN